MISVWKNASAPNTRTPTTWKIRNARIARAAVLDTTAGQCPRYWTFLPGVVKGRAGKIQPVPFKRCDEGLLRDADDRVEGRGPARLDLVAADRTTDGVAVGVEGRGAEDGRQVLRGHGRLEDF